MELGSEAKTVTCPTFLAPQDPRGVGKNKPLGDPLMSTGPDSGKWWRGKEAHVEVRTDKESVGCETDPPRSCTSEAAPGRPLGDF
jgi:hypothetical protein